MKVLIVGGGGREHALAWKLLRDDPTLDLIAAPGNPGMATLGRCVPIAQSDIPALLRFARREGVGLVVVGPEGPLAEGVVDAFRAASIPIFGPSRAAAEIETSKRFAKELMRRAGVPTAQAWTFTDPEPARGRAREVGAPVVIKASGLAAGKGVVVAATVEEAERAIDAMLRDAVFGDAGQEILVEEFMQGEELSIFALTDGTGFALMLPAQDHKRLLDGDRGPNTGGMGAYAPVSIGSTDLLDELSRTVFSPVLQALREAGRPFSGLLYAGLMLTADGPRVVEFNCRFGDPETQAMLPLLTSSLLDPMLAISRGEPLPAGFSMQWSEGFAVTTVVAAPGYPESPRTGSRVTLPAPEEGVTVFHAGTRATPRGLVTSGGRVLAVTAVAPTLDAARGASRRHAGRVQLDGKLLRSDIGWREAARVSGAGAS